MRPWLLIAALLLMGADAAKVPDAESAMNAAWACLKADGPEIGEAEFRRIMGVKEYDKSWAIFEKDLALRMGDGSLKLRGTATIVDKETGKCTGVNLD